LIALGAVPNLAAFRGHLAASLMQRTYLPPG
jgi:hypothetical protein